MGDGPTDFGSGYIFESQKGISDRRAARGMPPHEDFGQGRSFDTGTSSGGGGGLVGFLFHAIFWLIVGAGWLGWQMLKIVFTIFGMMLSRRR